MVLEAQRRREEVGGGEIGNYGTDVGVDGVGIKGIGGCKIVHVTSDVIIKRFSNCSRSLDLEPYNGLR